MWQLVRCRESRTERAREHSGARDAQRLSPVPPPRQTRADLWLDVEPEHLFEIAGNGFESFWGQHAPQ